MQNIKRLYRKLFKPSFWVCEYSIKPSQSSFISKESGSFACFGKTEEEASEDAAKHIQKQAQVSGSCKYKVRKPNLVERLQSNAQSN